MNISRKSISAAREIEDALQAAQVIDSPRFQTGFESYFRNGFRFKAQDTGKWCAIRMDKGGTYSVQIYTLTRDEDGKIIGEEVEVDSTGHDTVIGAVNFVQGFFGLDQHDISAD